MPGAEFFQTVMGSRFYEGTMPRIAGALEKLVKLLETRAVSEAPTARFVSAAPDSANGVVAVDAAGQIWVTYRNSAGYRWKPWEQLPAHPGSTSASDSQTHS